MSVPCDSAARSRPQGTGVVKRVRHPGAGRDPGNPQCMRMLAAPSEQHLPFYRSLSWVPASAGMTVSERARWQSVCVLFLIEIAHELIEGEPR